MILKSKAGNDRLLLVVIFVLSIFIFTDCQKVINVDLNEAEPRIVIEGLITDIPGSYTVRISKSGSYFNQPVLPNVSGARVIISDNFGSNDTLKETTPGIYATSKIKGIPGRTYTLKVLSENVEYISSTRMLSHVNIDSLSLVKSQSQHFIFGGNTQNEMHFELHCFFRDPWEKNFYRIKVLSRDTSQTEDYRLYDDQYTNGQVTELRIAHVTSADTYRVELLSLDKQTFAYYHSLEELLHTNPVFGSTPANPESGFSNGALGYFGASAVSSKTIVITKTMLDSLK
jgi:hypothetical protein